MHDRAKGFFGYLADVFESFFKKEEEEENTNSSIEQSDISTIAKGIREYANDKSTFKNLQFGILGVICNHQIGRPRMSILRELNNNPEERRNLIHKFRTYLVYSKEFINILEKKTDEELDEIIRKISLYFHLFTRMYFQ